jgi:DNA-binding transcriptional ArsR family regulator
MYNKIMDGFTAVADPTRRKIVEMLALQGQMSATQIADQFPVSAQAISQHLKILREAKVVHMDKRAQQRLYRVNPESLRAIESWAHQIAELWQERFDAIAALLAEEKHQDDPQENQST